MNVVKNQRESGFEKIHNLCIAHSLFNPHTGKRKNPPFLYSLFFGLRFMDVRVNRKTRREVGCDSRVFSAKTYIRYRSGQIRKRYLPFTTDNQWWAIFFIRTALYVNGKGTHNFHFLFFSKINTFS